MKSFLLFSLLFLFLAASTFAISPGEVLESKAPPGQVLVKLKPSFAYMNAGGAGMRTEVWNSLAPALSIQKVVSFSTFQNKKSSAGARAAERSGVDLRLYHQLSFDPTIPLDVAITQLYKTGIVEVAEPNYHATPAYIPNDPMLDQQYYIPIINALEAWDITKGSEDIVIAILDSGIDLDHPDLAANIYRNEQDPIDNVDNDNDGYVDNYFGWDFAGDDYETLIGDNDPNAASANISHGTRVAGCAAAVTDNGIGIAGVGFRAQLMALKHIADNDTRGEGTGYLENLLQGVVYAAEHGADVINASYGSASFSIIAQEIYKLAALGYNVTIVAAAGNANNAEPNYPSDYDYVLSVAASNINDRKASFSNFGYKVDLTAPGAAIYTTDVGGGYTTVSGTSFSAPIVSGAAALARSYYPDFDGAQIAELMRVTSDPAFLAALEPEFVDKMGRGRLDVLRALSMQSPSVRLDSTQVVGPGGDIPKGGQEALIWGTFINFLWPAVGAQVTLTAMDNEYVEVVNGTLELGTLPMKALYKNEDNPFVIQISEDIPYNTEVVFRLDYTAANYSDQQFIKILLNPSFVNIQDNQIATTITANGQIGYLDGNQLLGQGFVVDGASLLYEMGIIMGVSSDKLVNNVRSTSSSVDDDFEIEFDITKRAPGRVADLDVFGGFTDAQASSTQRLNVGVEYRAFVWQEAPYDKFIILEYEITNRGSSAINDLYFGLYADWDISLDAQGDVADWDEATNTGYVYTAAEEGRRVAGVQLLTGTPNYWALDNDGDIPGNPFGVYDGFTDAEKYRTISSAIGREQAGTDATGSDVSHTVAAGPFTIAPGASETVAFVLHGGSSIDEVLDAAQVAAALYPTTLDAARPVLGLVADDFPDVRLYPNPATGTVNLELPAANTNYQVRVFEATGRLLYTTRYAGNTGIASLNLPQAPGTYLVEVSQAKKRSVRRVVVH